MANITADLERGELHPCPFCGSSAGITLIPAHEHQIAKFMPAVGDTWVLECKACPAGFCGQTREEVVSLWNRRPPQIWYYPCAKHMGQTFTSTVRGPVREALVRCPICEPQT